MVLRNRQIFLTPLEKIKKAVINILNHYNSCANPSKNTWNTFWKFIISNMWVYRLILCEVIRVFLEKKKAPLQQEDPTLLYASNLTTKEVIRFSVAQYLVTVNIRAKKQRTKFILTLLLISGNAELNPGPPDIKCGECARALKFGASFACDQCNIWYHQECAGMSSTIFEMQWTCIKCGLPSISASLSDSSMSFINSSLNLDEDMLRVKSKSLRVVTVNFQSTYNKKDELSSFLIENDVDLVLGSETHLLPSINNAEILPQCTPLVELIEQMVGVG